MYSYLEDLLNKFNVIIKTTYNEKNKHEIRFSKKNKNSFSPYIFYQRNINFLILQEIIAYVLGGLLIAGFLAWSGYQAYKKLDEKTDKKENENKKQEAEKKQPGLTRLPSKTPE
jgi:hypothetical protein